MPRIRLSIEDDDGNPLDGFEANTYPLVGGCDTINQIEQAVEQFKNAALPDVEETLLSHAQLRFVGEGEKGGLRS